MATWCSNLATALYTRPLSKIAPVYLDHESYSYNCDPNFYPSHSYYNPAKGMAASTSRCLYGKKIIEYAAENALSFFEKYRDEPKAFSISSMEGHDMIGGSVKYIDEPLTKLLETLDEKGHL